MLATLNHEGNQSIAFREGKSSGAEVKPMNCGDDGGKGKGDKYGE